MSAKTAEELWSALYGWASGVLTGVEIIQSHENAPSPSGTYVCIDYAGTWRMAGTSASRMLSGDVSKPSPRVYTYRGTVQVREVDGDGENLMLLLESLENIDVQEVFSEAGMSVLKSTGPVLVPSLQQSTWRRESLLTLEMAWSRGYSGDSLYIQSVTITQEQRVPLVNEVPEVLVGDRGNVLDAGILRSYTIETEEA